MTNPTRRTTALLASALLTLTTASPLMADAGRGWWLEHHCEHGEGCLHGKLLRESLSRGWEGLGFDQAWDEGTGADRRHFPPDRIVHHEHMRLEMRFNDLNDRAFTARQMLRVRPIAGEVEHLTLHAVDLDIQSVRRADGNEVEHHADGLTLTMRFEPPLSANSSHEIHFEYECREPWDGLFFTPACPTAPHYGAEVHSQGQPESNRHWFISHDFPNEMLTTELIVNVPAPLQVSSNGRLLSHRVEGDRATWHWLQDKPHVIYLVTLVIGEFDRVPLEHERVPMEVWVPQGLGHLVEGTYGRTGAMLDLFERLFGVPYPWDRYDQLVVKNFGAGGMENTAATTMYPTAIFDEIALEDADLDGLIAHELAHQWAGNLLTCRSWAHIWLNEGWATISSALWLEERDGREAYLDSIRRSFGVARRDVTTNDLPMVSPIYGDPFETFRRAANPYPKGASIIHMLRRMLGEEAFWQGVHLYFNRHAHQTVETNDFRYALEEVSGLGLEWFFEQWCFRPGTPHLDIETTYDGRTRELTVKVVQTQHIDARTPAFRFTLPIYVRTNSGYMLIDCEVDSRETILRRMLDESPTLVAIDPWLHVLCVRQESKSDALWRAQLTDGPTIAARHDAAEALGRRESPRHAAMLESLACDPDERYTLRRTAVTNLAEMPGGADRIAELLDDGRFDHPRVRLTAVQQLVHAAPEQALPLLSQLAEHDRSYAVRAEAIRRLADHLTRTPAPVDRMAIEQKVLPLIRSLADVPSQHDQIRIAALEALGRLDDPEGLSIALRFSGYGHLDRMRPTAVATLGRLAHHDPARAQEHLRRLLHDPERRTARAAGAALAQTGDARARADVEAIARSHRNPAKRRLAEGWLNRWADPAEVIAP